VPQDGPIKLKMGRAGSTSASRRCRAVREKIVLRILDKGNLTLDLKTFGFEPRRRPISSRPSSIRTGWSW